MSNPTSGILDNYNLRFNWGTNQLEMNMGEEDWIAVPMAGGSPGGMDTQVQFNSMGSFGGSSDFTWTGTILSAPQVNTSQLNYDGGNLDISASAGDVIISSNGTNIVQLTSTNGPALVVNDGYFRGTGDTFLELNGATAGNQIVADPDSATIEITTVAPSTAVLELNDGVNAALIQTGANASQLALASTVGIELLPGTGTGIFVKAGGLGSEGIANASALVDINSTTAGFLPPRMTTTQRDAISAPAEGLTVYNTTTHTLNFWNGSAWTAV